MGCSARLEISFELNLLPRVNKVTLLYFTLLLFAAGYGYFHNYTIIMSELVTDDVTVKSYSPSVKEKKKSCRKCHGVGFKVFLMTGSELMQKAWKLICLKWHDDSVQKIYNGQYLFMVDTQNMLLNLAKRWILQHEQILRVSLLVWKGQQPHDHFIFLAALLLDEESSCTVYDKEIWNCSGNQIHRRKWVWNESLFCFSLLWGQLYE